MRERYTGKPEQFNPLVHVDPIGELKERQEVVGRTQKEYESWIRYTENVGKAWAALIVTSCINVADAVTRHAPRSLDIPAYMAVGITAGTIAGVRGVTAIVHSERERDKARGQVIPVEAYLRAQLMDSTSPVEDHQN